MTPSTPAAVSASSPGALDVPEWPSIWSLRTFTGQSVLFVTTRFALLVILCIMAASFDSTLLLVLAAAALAVDLGHIALLANIQVRGLALQHWVKRLVVGDLEHYVHMEGRDEICMYGRVLEALRQSMIRSRQLESAQRDLSEELRESNETLKATLDKLRATQDQIISQQKLAELGELSAGVAHEIRNPLQFVKNFAESSVLIANDLAELVSRKERPDAEELRSEIGDLTTDLTDNMKRISHHSDRANRIVADMLKLKNDAKREFRPVDINQLLVEQTMLAFHSFCAKSPGFNLEIQPDLDPNAGEISAVSADLGRVFINIVSNACQAIEKKQELDEEFAPALKLRTCRTDEAVEITI